MNETARHFAWLMAWCATTALGCSASTPDPSGSETHWLGTCPDCIHGAVCEKNVCVIPPPSPNSAAPTPTGSSPRPSTPLTDASFPPFDSSSGESTPPSNDRSPTDGGKFHVTPILDGGGATPIATGLGPEAGFAEAGVARTDSGPPVLTLFGAASGTVAVYPLLGVTRFASEATGIQISWSESDLDNLGIARGMIEFSLSSLAGVGVRRATLVMTNYVYLLSANPAPPVVVDYGYYAADLQITPDDYARDVTPIGDFLAPQTVQPDSEGHWPQWPLDVTTAVVDSIANGVDLGIRFQLKDDGNEGTSFFGLHEGDPADDPRILIEIGTPSPDRDR